MPDTFVAYFRVSTTKQGAEGLGIDAQKDAVQRFVRAGSLIGEFVEVESGKRSDRPELTKAIALAKKHGAKLVIAKLDRLSRNLHFITGLQESGVEFVAADMPQANNLNIHIIAAFAQHEREQVSVRTKAAWKVIKERIDRDGFYVTKDGRKITSLRPENFTREVIAKGHEKQSKQARERNARVSGLIASLRSNGMSLRETAEQLNTSGLRTARGGLWSATQVMRVEKAS